MLLDESGASDYAAVMSLHVVASGQTWTAGSEPLRDDRMRREVVPSLAAPTAPRLTALDRWGDGVGTWRLDLPASVGATVWHDALPLDVFVAGPSSPNDRDDPDDWRGYRRAVANERLRLGAPQPVTLWLKARPLPPARHQRLRVADPVFSPGQVAGLTISELCPHADARVVLLRFAPGTRFGDHQHERGEELVVIEGALEDEHGRYPTGTWVRQPPGSRHAVISPEGCLLYTHSGHLL